jgi:hypothetical protein
MPGLYTLAPALPERMAGSQVNAGVAESTIGSTRERSRPLLLRASMHEEDAMKIRSKQMAAVAMLAMFAAGIAGAHDRRHDHDGNPPGPSGGPGTNWENPPGWRGGPGASPDQRWWHHQGKRYEFRLVKGGYYFNPMYGYWHPQHGFWIQAGHCWRDSDGNATLSELLPTITIVRLRHSTARIRQRRA